MAKEVYQFAVLVSSFPMTGGSRGVLVKPFLEAPFIIALCRQLHFISQICLVQIISIFWPYLLSGDNKYFSRHICIVQVLTILLATPLSAGNKSYFYYPYLLNIDNKYSTSHIYLIQAMKIQYYFPTGCFSQNTIIVYTCKSLQASIRVRRPVWPLSDYIITKPCTTVIL